MPLQNHHFRTIKTTVLLLGAITPLYIGSLNWNGSVRSEMIPLVVWLLSPYVFGINCGVALVILAFSIWAGALFAEIARWSRIIKR